MPSVVTNDLRVQNARNFVDSVNTPPVEGQADGMPRAYVFAGRVSPWPNENRPPVPDNSIKEFYDVYDNMLSLIRIADLDCYLMIRNEKWIAGTIYDIYRHDYSPTNLSYNNYDNLYDSKFYVINQYNDVYVCLNNFFDSPSIDEPIAENDEPFFTSDGYQWLRMFSIRQQILYDYSTANFLPVTHDGVNIDNFERPFGEILTVRVDNTGFGFTARVGTDNNEITNYYCHITGNGTGAVANIRISASRVVDVRVVRPGSGYTFAELDLLPQRVYASLPDLDQDKNHLDIGGDDTFRSTVIIGPQNGWGYDIPRQLGATRVGVFSSFGSRTYDFFDDAQFRQVGILQDPEWNVDLLGPAPNTLSACYAMTVNEIDINKVFQMGELISQPVYVDDKTHYAKGIIVGFDEVEKILRYIVVPDKCMSNDGNIYPFERSGIITGFISRKQVEVKDFTGTQSNLNFVNGIADSEITHYTGKMTYLGNLPPVQRAATQTERVSLIIQY